MSTKRIGAIALTVFILILQSLRGIFIKIALRDGVDPLHIVVVGICVAMTAMGIYTFGIRRERIPPGITRQAWWYIVAIGIGNFAIGRFFQPFSLDRMPATTNAYLINFVGFLTMAMSIFILKEAPYIFQLIGAIIAIAGLRVFYQVVPPPDELIGILFVLIVIVAIAYTNNIARKLAQVTGGELSNNVISTMALMIGGSVAVVLALTFGGVPQIGSLRNWGIVLYDGLISMAVGLTVWNFILRTLRSYEASILGATTIIWTGILAIPLLGELLRLNQIIGMAMMLVGIALVQVRVGRMDRLFGVSGQAPAQGD